jgi:cytoskeletal protein CcmA (bactofilin family)
MWDSKNQKTLGSPKLEPRDQQTKSSRLGPSLFVKGEISGNEDLLIDGGVEGVVRLNERTLMIGPRANVRADITAGEVVVRGNLKGNILARGRIEVRNDGSVTGDLTTPQVFIEEGALFKGSIEIEKSTEKETAISGSESGDLKVATAAAGVTNV